MAARQSAFDRRLELSGLPLHKHRVPLQLTRRLRLPLPPPQAMPILNDALAALDTIKEADIA